MAIDSKRLLAEVRANLALLNDCGDHTFEPIVTEAHPADKPMYGRKYCCKSCGGVVDAVAAHWYERGRSHERAYPSKSPLGKG